MNGHPAVDSDKIVHLPKHRRTTVAPAAARTQAPVVVPFEHWVAVRDQAASGLLGGGRRLLLTGSPGTGKTILLEHLARVLRAAGRTVTVQLADAEPLPPEAGDTLFVDEADRLTEAKRRELQAAPGTLVLAGLASLAPRRPPAGTAHLTLEPLDQDASRSFVAQWLRLNGRTPSDLESPAVRRLIELSGGVPRLLSTLLASSLWVAETSGAGNVTAGHVQEAAELRSVLSAAIPTLEPEPIGRGLSRWSILLAVVVVAGATAAIVPRLFPEETERSLTWARDVASPVQRWLDPAPASPESPPASRKPIPAPVAAQVTPPVAAQVAPPPTPAPVVEPPAVEIHPAQLPLPAPALAPAPLPTPAPPTVTAVAPEPTQPVEARREHLPVETVAFLLRRGHEMMELSDLSAARLLFRRAAESGSAEAMLELARTFDPAVLGRQGQTGLADPAEAQQWYRRAAEAGSAEAEAILKAK